MENKKSLSKLVYDLDDELGNIGLRRNTLVDIEEMFSMLVTDMDNKVHRGEEKIYFDEWHRELRVLSELMNYTMKAFNKHCESADEIADEINNSIFEEVVRQGEKQEGCKN